MISEVQTAPNGLAAYQISINVTPASGMAIISGELGGASTDNAFAVGTTNADSLFTRSDGGWVENINNIEIINFNANGSSLSLDDISASFYSINTVNAQSTNDNVSLTLGENTIIYGKTDSQNFDLDLESLTGGVEVNEFSIGTGNTELTNKWSIEGINVAVEFEIETAILSNNDIMSENNLHSFLFYPNPASEKITFNTIPKEVRLYSLDGKLLKKDTSKSQSIDIIDLTTGVYAIQFLSEDGIVYHSKLLKK